MSRIFAAVFLAAILGCGISAVPAAVAGPQAPASPASGDGMAADAIDPVTPLLAKADIAHGQQLAKVCSACHSFEKDGPTRIGPNLWGIVGAPHAHRPDFAYSAALKAFPGVWDYESLNKFLYRPMQDVPGTRMGFAGLKKTQDRADLIAWLRTQSDNPAPLP